MSSPSSLPSRARVVVIGGGVIGTSIAYHLGHMGWADTVLVERDQLTSGTTWHAAGLMVTFGSTSETSTELRKYTRDLYTNLEAETGLATGFKPVGFIELAADPGRLEEYRRVSTFNRHVGVDVHELSPREVADMFPLARTDDLLAGFYVEGDGRVNPVDCTMSMAKGARQQGVTIAQGVTVTDVVAKDGAVKASSTQRACGPGNWVRCRVCPSRCRPPSTTTSSPRRCRVSTRRGRSSKTRATSATTAKRSVG